MNREQMIAKAATAIAWEPSVHYPDALQLRMHVDEDLASEIAAEIVDALLPQVTTVEELEALRVGSVLIGQEGNPIEIVLLPIGNPPARGYRSGQFVTREPLVILEDAPLTVVWQP